MLKEFSIDILRTEGDRAIVGGRCCRGPLRLKDKLTSVYEVVPFRADEPYGLDKPINEKIVNLTIVNIVTYQKQVGELSEGLTGEITLEGVGISLLKVDLFLGTL